MYVCGGREGVRERGGGGERDRERERERERERTISDNPIENLIITTFESGKITYNFSYTLFHLNNNITLIDNEILLNHYNYHIITNSTTC